MVAFGRKIVDRPLTRPKRRVTAPQRGHYLRLRSRAEPGQDFFTSVQNALGNGLLVV